MFWNSVIAGLKVLTFWETYVAGLMYLAIFFIPTIIAGIIMEKREGVGALAGCLGVLLMPVVQVAAMAVLILTLFPIILGFSEDAAWSLPWQIMNVAPGAFFKLVGVLVATAIIFAFIPLLGQVESFQTLVLGGIALVCVLGMVESVNPGAIKGKVDFIPDFWFLVGLIAIGGILSWIGIIVAALAASVLDHMQQGVGAIFMFPISAIFGFIPVFMYGAWLGAQVTGRF